MSGDSSIEDKSVGDLLGAYQVVESPLAAALSCLCGLLLEPGGTSLGSAPQLGSIDQLGLPPRCSLLEPLMYALDSCYAPVQVGQCVLPSLVPVPCFWSSIYGCLSRDSQYIG